MLCLRPRVVTLIILLPGHFCSWNILSIEISTGSWINMGLHHVVRISLGTPVGGLYMVHCCLPQDGQVFLGYIGFLGYKGNEYIQFDVNTHFIGSMFSDLSADMGSATRKGP